MLFGQSLFQSVLDRLKAEDDETIDTPSATRVSGLKTGLAFNVMEGVSASSARPGQAYFDNLEFAPAEEAVETSTAPSPISEPEPVMPEYLERITPEEIAAELNLSARDTVQSLNEKRRAFAKKNHPDGVYPAFRENATKRMTAANLLIDQALRRVNR